jgi:hypothetical protein
MKTWKTALAVAIAIAVPAALAAYIPSRQPTPLHQYGTTVPVNVTIIRVDCLNRSAGYAPPGTPIMVFETVLYADSRGGVRMRLWPATYYILVRQTFTYGRGWIKLELLNWTWSDVLYGTPRVENGTGTYIDFSASTFTRITIRYRDYRKLRVTYGSGGYVLLNGAQVANGTELWIPLNSNVTLTFSAGEACWYRGVRGAQPSFWMQNATATFTMDDGYWIHAEPQC